MVQMEGAALRLSPTALRQAFNEITLIGDLTAADTAHGDGRDVRRNPLDQVMRGHSDKVLQYAQQLGMTFISRARTPSTKDVTSNGGKENPFSSAGG